MKEENWINIRESAFLPAYISGFGFLAGQKRKNRNHLKSIKITICIDFETVLSIKLKENVDINVSRIFMSLKSFLKCECPCKKLFFKY